MRTECTCKNKKHNHPCQAQIWHIPNFALVMQQFALAHSEDIWFERTIRVDEPVSMYVSHHFRCILTLLSQACVPDVLMSQQSRDAKWNRVVRNFCNCSPTGSVCSNQRRGLSRLNSSKLVHSLHTNILNCSCQGILHFESALFTIFSSPPPGG